MAGAMLTGQPQVLYFVGLGPLPADIANVGALDTELVAANELTVLQEAGFGQTANTRDVARYGRPTRLRRPGPASFEDVSLTFLNIRAADVAAQVTAAEAALIVDIMSDAAWDVGQQVFVCRLRTNTPITRTGAGAISNADIHTLANTTVDAVTGTVASKSAPSPADDDSQGVLVVSPTRWEEVDVA